MVSNTLISPWFVLFLSVCVIINEIFPFTQITLLC